MRMEFTLSDLLSQIIFYGLYVMIRHLLYLLNSLRAIMVKRSH